MDRIAHLRSKDFRINKLFTTYKTMLIENFSSIYEKGSTNELDKDFKSFNNNSQKCFVPEEMKLSQKLKENVSQVEEEFENVKGTVEINEKCKSYFELRRHLSCTDLDSIEKLHKTIRSILIRKNILNKKQEILKINNKIKVRVSI